MKRALLAAALSVAPAAATSGQVYDNGGMNPLGGGCNGSRYTMLEAPSNVIGSSIVVDSFHQADNFVVPEDETWSPVELIWYLYQTDSPPSRPISSAYIQLWRGNPMTGGVLIAGDMETNRAIESTFSGVYRTWNQRDECERAVKRLHIDVSWIGPLEAGEYWIEIASDRDADYSGPWANPVVPRDGNENSIFYDVREQAWEENTASNGSGAKWDYPFKLSYTGGRYWIDVIGTCPGIVEFHWRGTAPGRRQAILFADRIGRTVIDVGACAGTTLDIEGAPTIYAIIDTRDGAGSVRGKVSEGVCGKTVQAVYVDSPCVTSIVVGPI